MTLPAEELYRRGRDLVDTGRFASGMRTLASARGRTSDPDLLARIAGTSAYALQQTGDPQGAERLCRTAMSSPGLSPETVAILNGQLGAIATYNGRLDEADGWLTVAIDALAGVGVTAANMRMNRSMVNMQRGRLDAASEDLAVAVREYAAHGRDVDQAKAQHNLGYVSLLAGDLVPAIQAMRAARAALEGVSPVFAAICDIDHAEVLRDAGLTTEAEHILARVARVFGIQKMRQARGEAEFNLARSLLTHDPVDAARVASAASRRFRVLGNETWAARAEGLRVRAVLGAGRVGRSGLRTAAIRGIPTTGDVDETASALEQRGLRSEGAAVRLTAELWRARHGGQTDGGLRVIRQPRGASMEVKLLAYEVRAARAAAAGRDRDARRQASSGLDVLSEWQGSFGSLDLQTSLSMHGIGLMIEGLAAAVRSRRPDVLFEWSERARHLSQQVVPLRPPPDPGLATDLAEMRMLRADAASGDWLADPRAAVLRDRARERQWSGTGSAAVRERVGLEEFRAQLDDETALLAYIFSGDTLSCLVVTRRSERIIDLGAWHDIRAALSGLRADLDVSAAVRVGPMAAIVGRALDERLAVLSAALLDGPIRVASGARRVVVTAPGVLNGVPWAMLPGMRARVFTLASSATRWVAERPSPAQDATAVAFAVGPRVARGDEEVTLAASAWPTARVIRGEEATVTAVTDLASVVDVLHVAAHGRHAVDNPLFSGLELADGALFGYDIDLMPDVPGTVVLSACEVGRSSVRWGEEAIGMTRTWLHAGTGTVIAAPVVVADDVACELLGALHSGLAGGMAPAEALAAASESTGLVAPFQSHGSGF